MSGRPVEPRRERVESGRDLICLPVFPAFCFPALALVLAALALAPACSRRQPAPPPAPTAVAAPASAPAATRSDAIVYRFQDHLAEAAISGPDPARALLGVGPRTRALVNPHGRAPGRRAYYLAELGFDRGRVADLLPEEKWPGDGPDHRGAPGGGGPMGGSAGVVDLRGGLLAPAGTTFEWPVAVPAGGYLAFDLGVTPTRRGRPLVARVDVDGAAVWTRALRDEEAGRWHPVAIDLGAFAGRTVRLRMSVAAGDVAAPATQVAVRRPAPRPAPRGVAAPGRRPPAAGAAPALPPPAPRPPVAAAPIGVALFGDPLLLQRGAFDRPNIVVLALDAVRADVVGAYGSDLGLTPNLDALAAEGTSFTQAIIPVTWTRPSVIGMLGGCYPQQMGTGTEWAIEQSRREQFYRGRPPLATLALRRAGYQTFTMGNAVLFVGYSPLGLDLGWDGATDIRDIGEETAATSRAVLSFLKQHRTKPFFLYVHLDTAHLPYNPPQRLLQKVLAGPGAKRYPHPNARGYLGEVAFADEQVGRIRAALERLGLAERTIFVVTADHGETIEREKYIVYPATNRNTIWGHGSTPFDNVLRVPLVMWKPGLIPAGKRIDAQVRTLDLAPSLLEAAGAPPDPRQCGRSLGPLLRGEPDPPRVAVSYSFYSTIVRADGWKLIVWHGEAAQTRLLQGETPTTKMQELYHVAVDPEERNELSAKQPAELRRMRALYAEATRAAARPVPREGGVAPVAAPGPAVAPAAAPGAAVAAAAPAVAAPAPAAGGPALVHLRVSPDGLPHRFEARIRSARPVAVRRLAGPARLRGEPGVVALEAEGTRPVEVTLEIDLEAGAEIEARVDGAEVPAERFFVGAFALALLDGPRLQLGRATWDAVRARGAPPREEPGLYVWGEGGGAGPAAVAAAPADDQGPVVTPVHDRDVTRILKGWGYIQGKEQAQ
jgi:arylsulfatase A-like enzyme